MNSEEYKQIVEKVYRPDGMDKKKIVILEQSWLKLQIDKGIKCGRCSEDKAYFLTIDHIIPQTFLREIGSDPKRFYDDRNFEVLCKRCNVFKSGRFDFANPKTKELLKEFVSKL